MVRLPAVNPAFVNSNSVEGRGLLPKMLTSLKQWL